MQADFWHTRWEKNEIGFHEQEGNAFLVKHVERLNLEQGSRVFLPLCGKTRDIAWLLQQGYHVIGNELSQLAIEQLFTDLNIKPSKTEVASLIHYQAGSLDIFVGDFFDLSTENLGQVDAIYDRAALVALPEEMRKRYTTHLQTITANAPQLLVTLEYDQSQMQGPPFSITGAEVTTHYADTYQITCLESEFDCDLKGKAIATERAWLLSKPK